MLISFEFHTCICSLDISHQTAMAANYVIFFVRPCRLGVAECCPSRESSLWHALFQGKGQYDPACSDIVSQ